MLKFILFLLSVFMYMPVSALLDDTANSFKTVVSNAYVKSQRKDRPDLQPAISVELNHSIELAAKEFDQSRRGAGTCLSGGAIKNPLSSDNCHIVTAMMGVLLKSGVKELVELYYAFVQSYRNGHHDFLTSVTGYTWGTHTGNQYEQAVYSAGNKLYGLTEALLGKGNSAIKNIVWVNHDDGWRVHQAWGIALLQKPSYKLVDVNEDDIDRILKNHPMPDIDNALLRVKAKDFLACESLAFLGCFWAGFLDDSLWCYFGHLFPDAVSVLPKTIKPEQLHQNKNLKRFTWSSVWRVDSWHDSPFPWLQHVEWSMNFSETALRALIFGQSAFDDIEPTIKGILKNKKNKNKNYIRKVHFGANSY